MPKTVKSDSKGTKPLQKPTTSLPRPKSSLSNSSKAETKKLSDDRWSRLATPKNIAQKAARKPATIRPQSAKIAPRVTKVGPKLPGNQSKTTENPRKVSKNHPKPAEKEPKTPKATRPKIEATLAQKSCPRELKDKKRRRTRFSVNTEELKQNLNAWRETDQGKLTQNPQRLWGSLSEQDSMSSTAAEVLQVNFDFSNFFPIFTFATF